MNASQSIPFVQLMWLKTQGCYREFGLIETIRRMFRELFRPFSTSKLQPDISLVTEYLAIGAAPRSEDALKRLRDIGFSHVVDLRAERKQSDILASAREISVRWVPTYDDWRPKSAEFYKKLSLELNSTLSDGGKLFICCGAGEHRAPLAGVLALVNIGYSLDTSISMIQKARPVAELLPVYRSSLVEFLENNHLQQAEKAN